MAAYSISFRIDPAAAGGRSPEARRAALTDTLHRLGALRFWRQTDDFLVFKSEAALDEIATACKEAIAPEHDALLLLDVHMREARIAGRVEDRSVFELIPFLVEV